MRSPSSHLHGHAREEKEGNRDQEDGEKLILSFVGLSEFILLSIKKRFPVLHGLMSVCPSDPPSFLQTAARGRSKNSSTNSRRKRRSQTGREQRKK
mmetsp:Transcript_19010/g.38428  ORF Transcript_19010/g.38428 Transcript_19010/m.38428 type:complete len:96 (-) Transcript_19010:1275-1562(-)